MREPRTAKVLGGELSAARDPSKRVKRHPEIEAAIGARVRALRVAAGLSQGALGEAVGISFQQVQKYELGKDRVAASTLQALAAVLGVHPGSFFDDSLPTPTGSVPNVKAAMRAADMMQRIRNPRVLKQLLDLAKTVVDLQGEVSDADSIGTL